ncbi:MAG TPA: hypothetical protein VFW65_32090 [Pseudonocardiaceae bacterium]|nr:hypothetical protein [Pseudonocardiaceae bacterium]
MSLLIYASDYTAWWLEYGSRHNAKYAVLRRTLDYLRSGTPRAATEYGGAEAYDAAHAGTQRKRELRRRYRVLRAARP